MSDLTTLTGQLADMKQRMIDRLTAQGKTGYTMSDTMEDIVAAYETLRGLDYCTDTITENGSYVAPNGKTGYNGFVVNIPAGGPATHKKYSLLDSIYEDIDSKHIGTVCGFHYDANGVEYAVVCLDAEYRSPGLAILSAETGYSTTVAIPGLPLYTTGVAGYSGYGAKETATFNCTKILDFVASDSHYTSPAITHCRNQVFTISGEQYAGQLPTLMELIFILRFVAEIKAADLTGNDYPLVNFAVSGTTQYTRWPTSTCCGNGQVFGLYALSYPSIGGNSYYNGNVVSFSTVGCIYPVLEIPNEVISE